MPALAEALARVGRRVELLTRAGPDGARPELAPDPALVPTHAIPVGPGSRRGRDFAFARALSATLRARLGQGGVQAVHDAGLWLPANHAAATEARRAGVPFVASPWGMLEPSALGYRAWRKALAWRLFQRRDLAGAALLHAISEMEAETFRGAGLANAVAVAPNGVDFPPALPLRPMTSAPPRTALFLSRLHPKKGLADLAAAWREARPAGWRMLVAGPDESGHRAEIEATVRSLGMANEWEFAGPVDSARKWELYAAADLFVLPTHSENFGLVVAEALAAGCPVLTTRRAPWPGLLDHACGWWIDPGWETLASALREACALTDSARRAMGARGAEWVRREFTWESAATTLAAAYDRLPATAPPTR